jgi:hypothetical protein
MVHAELEDALAAGTTRRKIVTTGAKLAYVAPAVAASSKLSAGRTAAQAVSGVAPQCNGATCGSFATCNETSGCICFSTSDGTGYCGVPRSCSEVQACSDTIHCPSGQICAVGTCCTGDKINSCVIPCEATAGSVENGARGVGTQAG